jgi:hypothetical protein
MMPILTRFSVAALAAAALPCVLSAQTSPERNVPPLPAQTTVVDDVVVPVPREIFGTLDRFRHSNWRAVLRPDLAKVRPRPDQVGIALQLGVVIAEGFVAAEAEDVDEVKQIGRTVLRLARGLGVGKWAIRRNRSIVEHADKGDWAAVRLEWDGVLPDVQVGMKELKSEQLPQLVSFGGWIRGTEVLSALILQNYTATDAALLRQPGLGAQLAKQLERMAPEIRNQPQVARIRSGLERVRKVLATPGSPMSREQATEMGAIAAELRKEISQRR